MDRNKIIEELKELIQENFECESNDYIDGVIDGLLIAIKKIEG